MSEQTRNVAVLFCNTDKVQDGGFCLYLYVCAVENSEISGYSVWILYQKDEVCVQTIKRWCCCCSVTQQAL